VGEVLVPDRREERSVRRFSADSNKLPKLRVNRRILRALERALSQADLTTCSVDDVHKEAMSLYLKTWVAAPLKAAILDMKGIEKSRW
jgi:hypothetical protein